MQCDTYCYFFFDNDTDTDTTFLYRHQINPYRRYTHNLIAQRETVLSWEAETCDVFGAVANVNEG